MKGWTVKSRITLWMGLMTVLLSLLLLLFLLSLSERIMRQTSMAQLEQVVRSNADKVSQKQGKLVLKEDFNFYHSNVNLLIYSKKEALLAGQVPVSFNRSEPFLNGVLRQVEAQDGPVCVLDLWIPFDWEEGVWLRGLSQLPLKAQTTKSLLLFAAAGIPLFVLLAGFGAYFILRRALRPLSAITEMVSAINDTDDLTARLPEPRHKDEFALLTQSFNGMFARLEKAVEIEKQFTDDASHELRTPVSIIKGACEVAEKFDETPQERRETLEIIHRQADKMANLISCLLQMTRLEHGTEKLQMEKQDISGLVARLLEEYDLPSLHYIPSSVFARIDQTQFLRLAQNLIDNALRYGKGEVWISVYEKGKEAIFEVKDNGIGIAPMEQARIWDRFYRVDASHSDEQGTGLGLAMVKRIAEALGGYMTLDSREGRGSTFALHLPLQRP